MAILPEAPLFLQYLNPGYGVREAILPSLRATAKQSHVLYDKINILLRHFVPRNDQELDFLRGHHK